MSDAVRQLLAELHVGLQRIYGPRLRGLYLFGSYAHGTPDPESDVDVLIVLDRIDRYGAEVDRTGELASRLSLKYGVTVSRAFAAEADWREGDSPFLNNIRPEAIPA
jgi:predicted nucleotidyltransferase